MLLHCSTFILSSSWPNCSVLSVLFLLSRNRLCFCHYLVDVNKASFLQRWCFPAGYHYLCSVRCLMSHCEVHYIRFLYIIKIFWLLWIGFIQQPLSQCWGDFPASDFKPLTFGHCRSRNFRELHRAAKCRDWWGSAKSSVRVHTYSLTTHPPWCNLFGIWLEVHLSEKTETPPCNWILL